MADIHDTLLLYAPVPLYRGRNGFLLEDQACNGLRLWSKHFGKVIVMHPVETGDPPPSWIPVHDSGIDPDVVELLPLPTAYRPDQFLRHLPATRRLIRGAIDRSRYLSFSIGGLFGDWGSVAAWEAHRKGRKFAIWTDRVESEVVRLEAHEGPSARSRLRARLTYPPMAALERFLIRRCTVGLFHGAETFSTYAPYAAVAEVVHDIHLKAEDRIADAALDHKAVEVLQGPLRIIYLGRADAMKGPLEWVDVMARLKDLGVPFEAHWLGQGALWEDMKQAVIRRGLSDCVHLPGFVRNRNEILDRLRAAHLFVFCHKTPESPRNLIESLVSGTPIIGYEGAFARDLIHTHQGGVLTPIGDTGRLTEVIAELAGNRTQLAALIQAAAMDGSTFNDEAVFSHRSKVIRQYLD